MFCGVESTDGGTSRESSLECHRLWHRRMVALDGEAGRAAVSGEAVDGVVAGGNLPTRMLLLENHGKAIESEGDGWSWETGECGDEVEAIDGNLME